MDCTYCWRKKREERRKDGSIRETEGGKMESAHCLRGLAWRELEREAMVRKNENRNKR